MGARRAKRMRYQMRSGSSDVRHPGLSHLQHLRRLEPQDRGQVGHVYEHTGNRLNFVVYDGPHPSAKIRQANMPTIPASKGDAALPLASSWPSRAFLGTRFCLRPIRELLGPILFSAILCALAAIPLGGLL